MQVVAKKQVVAVIAFGHTHGPQICRLTICASATILAHLSYALLPTHTIRILISPISVSSVTKWLTYWVRKTSTTLTVLPVAAMTVQVCGTLWPTASGLPVVRVLHTSIHTPRFTISVGRA